MLALVAAAETGSEHPVGEAIVAAARDRGLALPARRALRAPSPATASTPPSTGRRVAGRQRRAAHRRRGVDVTALTPQRQPGGRRAAQTPMFVAVDGGRGRR